MNSSKVPNTKRKHTMRYQSASLMYDTLGMELFWMFRMVVVVSTEVMPNAIRAATASTGMKKAIHDNITMRMQGANRWRKAYPDFLTRSKWM